MREKTRTAKLLLAYMEYIEVVMMEIGFSILMLQREC